MEKLQIPMLENILNENISELWYKIKNINKIQNSYYLRSRIK